MYNYNLNHINYYINLLRQFLSTPSPFYLLLNLCSFILLLYLCSLMFLYTLALILCMYDYVKLERDG